MVGAGDQGGNGAALPLVVAVTGHRDLLPEHDATTRARVDDFFDQLESLYPDLPVQLVSGMAAGADQLVAEVALERGIPVLAMLPMPQVAYEEDFEGEELTQFRTLLARCEVHELPWQVNLPAPGDPEAGDMGLYDARQVQYALLGTYIAAHCHILLALWDGRMPGDYGGTAQVVHFHQHGEMPALGAIGHAPPLDFADDESDLVFHVVCARQRGDTVPEELRAGQSFWLTRDDLNPRTDSIPVRYRLVFTRMVEFSRDCVRHGAAASRRWPLLPGGAPEPLAELAEVFHNADAQAMRMQRFTVLAVRATYICAGLAGLSFIAFADLPGLAYGIHTYLLFISAALGIHLLTGSAGWQRRYLDNRVLAEALRVQFYWTLAGARQGPAQFSHDVFLRRHDLELGWLRNVMRVAGLRADIPDVVDADAGVSLAAAQWVDDQAAYYRRSFSNHAGRNRVTSLLGGACFAAGAIVALALALFPVVREGPAADLFIALMGLLPLVAALRQSYSGRLGNRELMDQYGRMQHVFGFAARQLGDSVVPAQRRAVLLSLGRIALDEHARWLLRQRERSVAAGQLLQSG